MLLKSSQSKGKEKGVSDHNTMRNIIQKYMLVLWECRSGVVNSAWGI